VSDAAAVAEPLTRPTRRPHAVRRVLRRPAALLATLVVIAFVIIALGAPYFAPFDPIKTDYRAIRTAPSATHPLGTDEVGRDVLSRLIWGARASLLAGAVPVTIALVLSLPLGLLSGCAGGWLDGLIMRITDAMLAIPFLIVAIALAAFLGPSLINAMLAIGIAALPTFLRLARGTALALTTEEFVVSAQALGCSRLRVAVRHVLPNMLPPLLIQSSLTVAAAIIAEASLSFLGLGQQPPAPLSQAPWIALYPGLMIFTVVMALNVVGDGLRDALYPRVR
jgi:peptide/nickel transport system permease protein